MDVTITWLVFDLRRSSGKPGKYMLQGSTSLRSPCSLHAQDVLDRMIATTATHPVPQSTLPPFNMMVGYEFIPLKKVCAVRQDATAFHNRGPYPNVLLVISWDKEEEAGRDLGYARKCAKEIVKIVDGTEEGRPKEHENKGYANYGGSRRYVSEMRD